MILKYITPNEIKSLWYTNIYISKTQTEGQLIYEHILEYILSYLLMAPDRMLYGLRHHSPQNIKKRNGKLQTEIGEFKSRAKAVLEPAYHRGPIYHLLTLLSPSSETVLQK